MLDPISFALEILLDCKTLEEAQKKCKKYIKLWKAREAQSYKPTITYPNVPAGYASAAAQAPSTQRLLESHGITPMPAMTMPKIPPGTLVDNGDGTKSKRKW